MQTGPARPTAASGTSRTATEHTISYRVMPENTLAELPPPSPGDIFFDFEGDPLWQDSATGAWGLEYLFGVIEAPAAPGAPGIVQAVLGAQPGGRGKQALPGFPRLRGKAPAGLPGHARLPLRRLREDGAPQALGDARARARTPWTSWLRDGLLVDLYQTVRNSLRISENSYSIKKLEPLYMGTSLRSGDVKDAGASVVAYAHYCQARDDGQTEDAETDPGQHLGLQRVRLPLHAEAPGLAAGPGRGARNRAAGRDRRHWRRFAGSASAATAQQPARQRPSAGARHRPARRCGERR